MRRSLTHRSVGHENNERLEFLGDAVLNLVIAEAVFSRFPELSEGDLSRARSALVRESSLASIARDLNLGDHVVLGLGELKSGGFRRESILADALEAIIGATLLDGGFQAAKDLVLRLASGLLETLPSPAQLKDAKTRLQEFLQGTGRPLPEYEVLGEDGPPHRRVFSVRCCLADLGLESDAQGLSRREAEQVAAEQMLSLCKDTFNRKEARHA